MNRPADAAAWICVAIEHDLLTGAATKGDVGTGGECTRLGAPTLTVVQAEADTMHLGGISFEREENQREIKAR
jgi:hypothetical protein